MNDFSKNPIKSEFIESNNNKISASLYEYDDHILFNEYLIGEEIYGVTLFKCLHNRIKILKSDLRKFTFDLLLLFLNKSIHQDDFITHFIHLKKLCQVYEIKFEEISEETTIDHESFED